MPTLCSGLCTAVYILKRIYLLDLNPLGRQPGRHSGFCELGFFGNLLLRQARFNTSSPRLLNASTELTEPKTRDNSTKYLFNHEKPWSLRSLDMTGMFL